MDEDSKGLRETKPLHGTENSTSRAKTQPINPRRKYKRQITAADHSQTAIDGLEDGSDGSMSAREELEMDNMASDAGSEADEETGLTKAESRNHLRKKRRRTALDNRIGGDSSNIDIEQAKLADQNVVKRLLVNSILIVLWYLFSLSISIYNKWMFSSEHLDFHFPLFTTSLHMVVQFTLASLTLLLRPSLRPKPPPTRPTSTSLHTPPPHRRLLTPTFYLTRLLPCGTATSLDIGLGNTSLRYITLTFLTMCKSSALAFVLLFAFLFRLEAPSWRLVLIIATMTAGVIMMVAGEAAFNLVGFVLVLSSAFFSGFRWAVTQILLLRHPATSNPFSTLFFLTPIMFVSLLCLALAIEQPAPILTGIAVLSTAHGGVKSTLLLLFPGLLAFCMTSAEFALLQRTSVVTLSICGIFKEVVTISAAGIVFHDPLTPINVSGLLVTIASIAAYNYLKITKMRRDARKEIRPEELDDEDEDEDDDGADDAVDVGASDFALDRDEEDEDEENEEEDRGRQSIAGHPTAPAPNR